MRRVYAPVAISSYCSPSITQCTNVVVHVGSERMAAATLRINIWAVPYANGDLHNVDTRTVTLDAMGSVQYTINNTQQFCAWSDCLFHMEVHDAQELLSMHDQYLSLFRDAQLKPATLSVQPGPNFESVTVSSNAVAPSVMVYANVPGGHFSDNALLLLPNSPVTLTWSGPPATAFYAVAINGFASTE